MDHQQRQHRLALELRKLRLGGMLVTHLPNVRYLCGFTGSNGVLAVAVSPRGLKLAFFTDGRYTAQAAEQVSTARVVIAKGPAVLEAAVWLAKHATHGPVAFESEKLSVAAFNTVKKTAGGSWKPLSQSVEQLRMLKEPQEVAQLRAAVLLASSVFEPVVRDIKPGITESAIAAQLEYLCRRMGAEGMSFDTLVSSGERSALPHGVASQRAVAPRGFIILDYGVILGGYCSDMTRTVHVGKAGKEARNMYNAVLQAQLRGIEAVRAGVLASDVDRAARTSLQREGLAKYFTHSTGHGVGLEIHEPPGLRQAKAGNTAAAVKPERLEAGMVITIEPGVYIPGTGGVRIEDMVLVTQTGCEVLTPTPKQLIEI